MIDDWGVDAIGTRLRKARLRMGLSQRGLAEALGLDPTMISHLEGGRRMPSVDSLVRLADELNVTTDYLLGRPQPVTDAVDEYVGALRAEVARLLSDADDAIAHGFFDNEEEEAYMHGRAEALAAVRALFEEADDD